AQRGGSPAARAAGRRRSRLPVGLDRTTRPDHGRTSRSPWWIRIWRPTQPPGLRHHVASAPGRAGAPAVPQSPPQRGLRRTRKPLSARRGRGCATAAPGDPERRSGGGGWGGGGGGGGEGGEGGEAGEAAEAGPGDLAGGSSDGGTDLDAADLEDEVSLEDVAGPADVDMVEPDEADLDVEAALDLEDLGDLESADGDEAGGGVDLEDDGADTAAEDLDDALADGELAEAAGTPGLTAPAGHP